MTSCLGHQSKWKKADDFDTFDYVLLTLLACLGLVWARIFFMFAVVTSPCAEHIASFGCVSSGWLAGQTVWSMLYGASALATVFCFTVIITCHSGKHSVATLFRQVLFVGFGLLTLATRSLVIEDPLPPDGLVLINHSAESLSQFPISREALLTFDTPDDVFIAVVRLASLFSEEL